MKEEFGNAFEEYLLSRGAFELLNAHYTIDKFAKFEQVYRRYKRAALNLKKLFDTYGYSIEDVCKDLIGLTRPSYGREEL